MTIFDTNAYRVFTFGLSLEDSRAKAIGIRQQETRRGVLALASPMVIWELASHLADTTDPAYAQCQNALVALAEHTRSSDVHNPGICMALDSEWVVCDALFQKAPPGAEQNISNLAKLANYVRDHAPTLTDPAVLANLQVFSREMAKRESTWLADFQKLLHGVDPATSTTGTQAHIDKAARQRLRKSLASAAFEELWAAVAVIHYADLVGVALNSGELERRSQFFREQFSVPFHLILTLIQNLLGQSKLDLFNAKKKRGNFMWDAGISYVIPTGPVTNGTTTLMVTGDKAILAAAGSAGCAEAIVSLEHYCKGIDECGALPGVQNMQLKVEALPLEDTWKDIVRINQKYRKDSRGHHIARGAICRITVGNRSKWVIMHGRENVDAVVQMDLNVKLALSVEIHSSYDFSIERMSWIQSLWFPWKASDPVYRLPAQLSVVSLIVGVILGVLGILLSRH